MALLVAGCIQPESGVKYVCADGKTVVSDTGSCPPGAAVQQLTQEEKDLAVCSGMPSTQMFSFEDYCIIGVAGKYKNSSLCRKAAKEQRMACYTIIAELRGDPAACSEAGTQADQCLNQYAMDKKDSSVCEKITDVSYRDNCYTNMANQLSDPELCAKIRNINQKDSCYFNFAMRYGDQSYCNRISNSNQQQNCRQNMQGKSEGGVVMQPQPVKQMM